MYARNGPAHSCVSSFGRCCGGGQHRADTGTEMSDGSTSELGVFLRFTFAVFSLPDLVNPIEPLEIVPSDDSGHGPARA